MENQFIEMGRRIQTRRKELHIKQSELAETVDISNNHMSSIETGKQLPSLPTFMLISNALQVTPDYLLLGSMHATDTPLGIANSLRLCSPEDIEIVRTLTELLVKKNQNDWNKKHFI